MTQKHITNTQHYHKSKPRKIIVIISTEIPLTTTHKRNTFMEGTNKSKRVEERGEGKLNKCNREKNQHLKDAKKHVKKLFLSKVQMKYTGLVPTKWYRARVYFNVIL